MRSRVPIVWDMETGDPDDFLTLFLLCGHPRVELKAVTITPGTPAQVGLVRFALRLFDLDIPVGAFDLSADKQCVSGWHYAAYGNIPESHDAEEGWRVLERTLDPDTTLVTGAPLKNLGRLIREDALPITGRWVAQGGFAGEGVVPAEWQLEKFKGMKASPTYNFNGDPKGAMAALTSRQILSKRLVSKNVCHGVWYDRTVHERLSPDLRRQSRSLRLIWTGMEYYLRKHPAGKKFHDPLAACCAIDPAIGMWSEPIAMYREKGKWGARMVGADYPDRSCRIILRHDHERFLAVLTER